MAVRHLLWSSESEEEAEDIPKKIYKERLNYNINHEFEFKESFRLNFAQVNFLLEEIGPILERRNHKNKSLSAREQLLTTLHWMGNGSQYHGIAAMHGIDKTTVCRKIHLVANTIVNHLLARFVRWPDNTADLAQIFFRKGGFPLVCGCVDGTLIKLDAPHDREDVYVDRNGNHSSNIMMICGPNNYFYAINSNWPGSVHDSRVLRNSRVFRKFEEGWRPFPGAIVLGDSAYPLKNWLIPPLRRNPEHNNEIRFNRAHKKTRRLIEDSFGILKEKFPCLNYLRLQPRKAAIIINACCILHNIAKVIGRDEEEEEEINIDENLDDNDNIINNNNNIFDDEVDGQGENKLQQLLNYFN